MSSSFSAWLSVLRSMPCVTQSLNRVARDRVNHHLAHAPRRLPRQVTRYQGEQLQNNSLPCWTRSHAERYQSDRHRCTISGVGAVPAAFLRPKVANPARARTSPAGSARTARRVRRGDPRAIAGLAPLGPPVAWSICGRWLPAPGPPPIYAFAPPSTLSSRPQNSAPAPDLRPFYTRFPPEKHLVCDSLPPTSTQLPPLRVLQTIQPIKGCDWGTGGLAGASAPYCLRDAADARRQRSQDALAACSIAWADRGRPPGLPALRVGHVEPDPKVRDRLTVRRSLDLAPGPCPNGRLALPFRGKKLA